MLFIIITGIFIFGFILYKLTDFYAQQYLGFNSIDHTPVYTPWSSVAPTLVCVLGWGGCTRRQLRRLLEFYSEHEIPTISWISPMLNYMFPADKKQIEHLLDLLLHENRNSNNIIIHLHSNNGALAFGYMLDIIKTNQQYHQLLPNIKGIIFDSGPFIRFNNSSDWIIASAIGTSRACVSIILNRAQYFHSIWSPLITYYLFIRFFHRRYLSSDPSSSPDKVRTLLHAIPIDIKQCYLYSDGDRLIPPSTIGKLFCMMMNKIKFEIRLEQFMAIQVTHGVQVVSHRFIDSGHVNHFRLYPQEYGKIILDFIVNIHKNNLSDKLK